MLEITIQDIKDYLDSKGPDDVVGEPRNACGCLIAECIKELYGAYAVIVDETNMEAEVKQGDAWNTVKISPEVTNVADKFDDLPMFRKVTKKTLEDMGIVTTQ